MIKGSLIGHAIWLSVALGAFGLGYVWHGEPSGEPAENAEIKSARTGSRSNAFSSVGGDDLPASANPRETGSNVRRKLESESSALAATFRLPKTPLSQEQIDELAQKALKDPNPIVRRLAFSKLLEAMTAENAQSIRKHLAGRRSDSSQWRDFHYAWGAIDGEAAMASAIKSNDYDLAYTMSGWAAANPQEAIDWFANEPDNPRIDRSMVQRSLVSGLADTDPAMATDYVFGLASAGDRSASDLLGIVASEVLRASGPVEAAAWSEGLPDGGLKGAAMDRVAHEYVAANPQAAAAWAQQYANESYGARVIEEVGDEWAKRDPAAAVGWLESLRHGDGQSEGLNSAFNQWANRDAPAASQHLFDMPNSPARDAAVSGFVRGFAGQDPQAAITWAESISNNQTRVDSLTRAGQALFRQDANAARTWAQQSGLPPAAQQAVINPPRRR